MSATRSADPRTLIREAAGYGAASAAALAVDVAILWTLVHFLGWGYLSAATTSFLAGAVVAYVLSVKLAFKQHRLCDRRVEFLSFVAIGTLGLVVNAAVMSLAINYLGLHYLLAKGVAAGCTFTCNFIARRQILFVRRSAA
ncbi:MAG TPA: GtrA family protein [Steroidobacteraceae bacterium]|nr:GtrA family protein [Steroidobacteraceae bacterium]